MRRIALATSFIVVFISLLAVDMNLVFGVVAPPAAQQLTADGGRTLAAPPVGSNTSPSVAGNPAALRYVTTYWAADNHTVDLSKTVNAAAHRYHLSPVGLLAIVLSECSGYTTSPTCDRYGAWPDWSHGSCQVTVQTAAQFGVGNGTEGADAYVKAYEDVPPRCIWLAAKVLRNFKNASGDSFPLLAADWNCGSSRYLYTEAQCYQNHQHFLQWYSISARFGTNNKPRVMAPRPRAVGYDLLDMPSVQQRLWHIPVTTVVESSTIDEAGLTGGYQPIRDTDAITYQWTHQRVYAPGGSQDVYGFRGCLGIAGSGTAALMLTPTDQYFALLHLATCPLDGVGALPVYRYTGPLPRGQDDATGAAIIAFLKSKLPGVVGVRPVRGGTFLGLSGWPSSYQYSNGSCYSESTCGIDAHLCEILTPGASDWFLWLAAGNDRPKPRPKPRFPIKAWQAKTHRVPAYDRHHHLRPEAAYWWHHARRLGGVLREERWHKPRHGIGYETMPFVHGLLRYWPKTHAFKVVLHA